MFDHLAQRALDTAVSLGASYADVRVIEKRSESFQTKDLTVSGLNRATSAGLGVRVLCSGGWGFASTCTLTASGVDKAVAYAVEVAQASARCLDRPIELAPEPAYTTTWVSPHLVNPFSVSTERKLEILFSSAREMLSVKGVTLTQGVLEFIEETKVFYSTEGSRIKQISIRSGCGIEANATNDSDRQRRSWPQAFGQYECAGWEMVERWDLPGNAKRIAEEAVALLTAPVCPQGRADVIIGSSQMGLQIHESCGHPSELDRALGQEINFAGASFLTPDNLCKLKYGDEAVNLVADATAGGALGSFGFDDEGVQAQSVHLVKDGIFCGYLSSRDTASMIGLPRSGGAMRAESWKCVPIIRMTNISLVAGDAGSLDDLIAGMDDGIYMETNKSWSIDSMRYNFQFSTEIGWEVKNGKLGRMLKNPSYSGITPEFWGSAVAIGGVEDYVYWGTPNCGKGQPMQSMWTGHGSPPVRFNNVQVGIAKK